MTDYTEAIEQLEQLLLIQAKPHMLAPGALREAVLHGIERSIARLRECAAEPRQEAPKREVGHGTVRAGGVTPKMPPSTNQDRNPLPVVDARCFRCKRDGVGSYCLSATCGNCGSKFTARFSKGHESSLNVWCPVCKVRRSVSFGGLVADPEGVQP